MSTPNIAANPANITLFKIYSNVNGNSSDVRGGVVNLSYFESVLENTIRVSATIIDTGSENGNVLQLLELSGFEKVELEFNDNQTSENKLRFTGNNSLYISKIRNIYSHTQKTAFTIDLVSKEFLLNEQESSLVYKRYDGEISSSVKKIMQDYLKTSKSIFTDTTVNTYNFIGDAKKPMRLCTEMARFCIPDGVPGAKGKVAGYLFFETYDGYNFKSIDKLLDDSKNQPQLGGKKMPKLTSDFTGPSRKSIRRLDIGQLPNGSTSKEQLKGAFTQNLDAGNVIAQSAMRYNQLFTLIMTITIAGDISIRAGDLIYCDFPGTTPKENPDPDKEISGIYMISDICHFIEPKRTFTKMNLVRGSFGRTPK